MSCLQGTSTPPNSCEGTDDSTDTRVTLPNRRLMAMPNALSRNFNRVPKSLLARAEDTLFLILFLLSVRLSRLSQCFEYHFRYNTHPLLSSRWICDGQVTDASESPCACGYDCSEDMKNGISI